MASSSVRGAKPSRLAKGHYETLAAFRHGLRRFLHFSQSAALAAGLHPRQHQALLAIKGFPGRDHVSVRELADHLQLRHNSAVGLVDRLVVGGWVRRDVSPVDRRQLEVRLTARGERLVEKLSAVHLQELRELRPGLRRLLEMIEAA